MRKLINLISAVLLTLTVVGCASTKPAPESYNYTSIDGIAGKKLVEDLTTDSKTSPRNVGILPLNDNAIAREATIKKMAVERNNKSIETVLARYPQDAYRIKVGKYSVVATNPATNKTTIKVAVAIKFDPEFISQLEEALKSIAYKQRSNVDIRAWGHELDSKKNKAIGEETLVFLFSNSPNMLSNSIVNRVYYVNVGRFVSERDDKIIANLAREFDQAKAEVLIQLVDTTGTVIDGVRTNFYDYSENAENFMRAGATPLVMKSVYSKRFGQLQDLLWLADKVAQFEAVVEVDNEQLNTATSMQASFISYNN
jgi:hypothetical protein